MISLEQIKTLNEKVQSALDVIVSLREENSVLKSRLGEYEKRIAELESMVGSFSRDQDDIENGILNILQQLDKLEDEFSSKYSDSQSEKADSSTVVQEENEASDKTDSVKTEDNAPITSPAENNSTDSLDLSETISNNVTENEIVDNSTVSEPAVNVETASEEVSNNSDNGYEKTEPEAELDIF